MDFNDWYIECGGVYIINNNKVFGRNIFVKQADMSAINGVRNRFNNTDVYYTNYIYDNKNQNEANMIGPLYIDLDCNLENEEDFYKIKEDTIFAINYLKNFLYVPAEYINIYFAGNKGFHIIVSEKVFGIKPCNDLNIKYKIIVNEIKNMTLNKTIDTGIYDKKRLIRFPHSINSKKNLYKVPITEEDLKKFSLHDIIEYSKTDKNINHINASYNRKSEEEFNKIVTEHINKEKKYNNKSNKNFINPNYKIPICVKCMYNSGAIKGTRNNTLVILSSALLQKGIPLKECIELMYQWNIEKNDEPLDNREVENTVTSSYNLLLNGKRYGCSSIIDLGYCQYEKCRIYRSVGKSCL